MSLLLLTFGPTHSGKTTFGEKLRDALGKSAKFIHVDNDAADAFIKQNFNNLRTDPDVLSTKTPENPDLRLLIPQLVAGYALNQGYSVIATAAHPRRVIRRSYYKIAADSGAKVVLLIFRITDAEAADRIRQAERNNGILDISPHGGSTFPDLFEKQKSLMDEPTGDERQQCFKVFEVNPQNAGTILDAAAELVRKYT